MKPVSAAIVGTHGLVCPALAKVAASASAPTAAAVKRVVLKERLDMGNSFSFSLLVFPPQQMPRGKLIIHSIFGCAIRYPHHHIYWSVANLGWLGEEVGSSKARARSARADYIAINRDITNTPERGAFGGVRTEYCPERPISSALLCLLCLNNSQ